MVNWKVRLKNKYFWITIIPSVLLLVQVILNVFNIQFEYSELADKLIAVVNSLFVVLAIIGVVNDPTTKGLKDSTTAMSYKKPNDT